MAKIKQKQFDTAHRAINVLVEDDFGHDHHVQVKLALDACPCCGRAYPMNGDGFPDVAAIAQQVMQELDEQFDKVLPHFEAHGADMTAHKARRDENRNTKGNAGRCTAVEGLAQSDGRASAVSPGGDVHRGD